MVGYYIPSLQEQNPLKMDGWNTIVYFWDGLFSGALAVSFRECKYLDLFCLKSQKYFGGSKYINKAYFVQDVRV